MQDSQGQPSSLPSEMTRHQRLSLNSEDRQKEQQLMQDTHLLLTNLAEREQATVKAILDSLYEVCSVNLINKKVRVKALRGPLKGIANFSKPVFQLFAWRWFKRNCPELITNWLYRQVRFDEQSLLIDRGEDAVEPPIEVLPLSELPPARSALEDEAQQQAIAPIIEKQAQEILALRGRITLLSSALVFFVLIICLKGLA